MIITAKYASTCPTCKSAINVGDKVEWTKGAKAQHVSCVGSTTAPSSPVRSYGQRVEQSRRAWGRARGMGAGHGSAPRVAGYSSYCTDNASCRCYDCAS